MTEPMNDALWLTLGKTDPKHTKGFKRSGGFSGTALKPMWVWERLTAHFGPMGKGWGCFQPSFQVVPTETEILVYCTVSAWHGSPENVLWGVGGDKCVSVNKYGPSADDEAFKKAFTDALMNAFKFIGVGADIHMGLFDDSKYVAAMEREFAPQQAQITPDQVDEIQALIVSVGADVPKFLGYLKVSSVEAIPATSFNAAKAALEAKRKKEAA